MGLIEELRRFRVIDAHAHNWSLFADTAYLQACLDRFELKGIVMLSNLTGGYDPTPAQIAQSNEDTARLRDAVGARILPFVMSTPLIPITHMHKSSIGAGRAFAPSSFGSANTPPTSGLGR